MDVSAWGMNVIEFDADTEGYPEHNHEQDGQQEVYLVLNGSIVLMVAGAETILKQGDMVQVPPAIDRKFITRVHSATLLAIGGTAGKAYTPDPRIG